MASRPGSAPFVPGRPTAVTQVVVVIALVLVLITGGGGPARAAEEPRHTVSLSLVEAAKDTEITVSGTGWSPKSLLMLLVCGQNMIGGTSSCANSEGRVVSTGSGGAFAAQLPLAAPPKPCPCVVHVAAVTGSQATADAPVKITGHAVAALPPPSGAARLTLLSAPRLNGADSVLTWFGAPPSRRLQLTVGNLGSAPAEDPRFQIGTARGVFAPVWEERQWRGTIPAGGKARVELEVSLPAGAHGDYLVSLKHGERVLALQPWGVTRPWGVTLFWVLLALVVPAAAFRIGMAVVERARPPFEEPRADGDGPGTAGREDQADRPRGPDGQVPPAVPPGSTPADRPGPWAGAERRAEPDTPRPERAEGEPSTPQGAAPENSPTTKGQP
ncbi:hypothetical protein [Streptomyces sp. NPDC006879]|uniref:hypothetical protein n=1 Tax=Streptomyces sp. NPDC006879 TaxID=3364767 RepID=UPI00367CB93A